MSTVSGLMLLTSNHMAHDDQWIFNCSRPGLVFCLACALEQLEDPEKPSVKKKFLLTEMLKVVIDNDHELLQCLNEEQQVSVHLLTVLTGLFDAPDDSITASAIEVIVQLCCQMKNEDLVCGLVDQVTSQCLEDSSFQHSLPSLTLIGRLLQSIPPLADLLQRAYTISHQSHLLCSFPPINKSFTEYLLTGLQYPDEDIQSAVMYILLHLVGSHMTVLKEPLVQGLIQNLLAMISSARSPELIMNSLGLLKKVVESERSVHQVIAADNHSLVSSAFKKVLLSRNDIHQITVVQCLTHLVMVEQRLNQRTFTEYLLSADIAEFLFESLATTNDILLSSIFCCLLVLTDSPEFFQECHAVYGIDSVVRATNHAIKLRNKDILCQGLDLVKKMLERQPTNVSLINSSSLLKAMSSLLSSCLRHSQISIVCCAAGVFQELLRKDHLKSPIDFCALEVPLKAIMETWKDLRPLSSLARTKTSRSSTASLTKEDNQNKRYEENKKCLAVGLAVMNSALKLCILCQKDPTSNTSLFRAPNLQLAADEEMMDVDQFIQFLLKLLDSSCIPHVMVNYSHLDDAGVCRCFFNILCHVYQLSPPDLASFSSKLASASFIQLSLDVKSKFCSLQSNCDVGEQVDSFLLNLCRHLLSDDDKTCLAKMQSALKDINCPAYNICGFMREQSSMINLSSASILDLQSTCLALMYLAAVHGDPLVNDNEVFESLHFYLSSPNCLVHNLDQTSLKHFIYLYADSYSNATLGEQTPSSLIHVLEKIDPSDIYSDHPSVIQWVYSAHDVPQNIRRGFFVQWLRHIPSALVPGEFTDEENYMMCTEWGSGGGRDEGSVEGRDEGSGGGTDRDSVRSKDQCRGATFGLFTDAFSKLDNPASKSILVEDILDVIVDGDEALLSRCLSLIKASMNATGTDPFSDTARLLQERLPEMVQTMFLKDPIQPVAEMKISAILKLVTEINLRALDSICPVDLKLVYHVSNLLTKSTSSKDTKLVILNCLHCLLLATVHQQDTSVLSVVLSNKALLQLMENILKDSNTLDYLTPGNEHLQCSTLSLLATLLQFQHQHQMKGCVTVAIDVNWLIDSISTHKSSFQRYAALKFWTAIFETKFATSSLIQLSEGGRRQELLQNDDINLDIKTDHLRLLVIHLQNLIMMDSGSESLSAVVCYTALLEYVHNKDQQQGEMLLRQPWNAALLSVLLQIQSSSFISPTVIQLYNMFVCSRCWNVRDRHLDDFIQVFCSIDTWSQITTNSYHMLLHIIDKISCYLSQDQRHCLQNAVEESNKQLELMRKDTLTSKLSIFDDIVFQTEHNTLPPGPLHSTLDAVTQKLTS